MKHEGKKKKKTRVKRFPIPNCDDVVVGVLKIIYVVDWRSLKSTAKMMSKLIQNRSTPYIPTTPKARQSTTLDALRPPNPTLILGIIKHFGY